MPRGQPEGEAVYRPEVSAETLPRKMVPEIRDLPLARGEEALGAAVQQKYQADSATYATEQVGAFRTKVIQDLEARKAAVPAGTDPGNFAGDWLSSYDKDAQAMIGKTESNPLARSMIARAASTMRETLSDHVMGWEAAQRVAYREDAFHTYVRGQSDLIEAHPELLPSAGSTGADMANSIGGDPSRRLARMREMDAQFSEAAANGLSRQDPRGAIEALNHPEKADPRYAPLGNLNDVQREQVRNRANGHLADPVFSALSANDIKGAQAMLDRNADIMDPRTYETVQRSILAHEEHQLVTQEKQQKVLSDDLSKQGDALLAQGRMTSDWIATHSRVLEANEVRYFYKAISGTEEAATSPRTFSDLFLRAASGEDVRDEARKHLVDDHDLSRADFTKIAGLVDQARPGWFKRGTQSIAGSIEPGQYNPDPNVVRSRQLALDDWQDWAQKHPNATDNEAKQQRESIIDHYRIIPQGTTVLDMKAPAHLIGTRNNPLDEQGKPDPMLNATSRRMTDAFKNGQITQSEAEEEAALILQYRKLYQDQQTAKAAKAKPQ